jgi:hypothetical protein
MDSDKKLEKKYYEMTGKKLQYNREDIDFLNTYTDDTDYKWEWDSTDGYAYLKKINIILEQLNTSSQKYEEDACGNITKVGESWLCYADRCGCKNDYHGDIYRSRY